MEEWGQFASMEKYHTVKIVISQEARFQSRHREETSEKPEKDWRATFESGAPELQLHRFNDFTTQACAWAAASPGWAWKITVLLARFMLQLPCSPQ
jgi:hypothetical protein